MVWGVDKDMSMIEMTALQAGWMVFIIAFLIGWIFRGIWEAWKEHVS